MHNPWGGEGKAQTPRNSLSDIAGRIQGTNISALQAAFRLPKDQVPSSNSRASPSSLPGVSGWGKSCSRQTGECILLVSVQFTRIGSRFW